MMLRACKVVLCVLLTAMCLAGLGCGKSQGDREIKLAYVNWSDATALTYLAQAVLEDRLGYDVELTMADAAPVFTSVADGGHDAFLDAWLPVTHAVYMDRFEDRLVDLGPNYTGTRIGLVVPEYVEARSIADLQQDAHSYDNRIIGIDSGAGIMQATERAIEHYGLDFRLLPSSEAAMTAALKEAIDESKPVVVTGWNPHWKFARWKLRFLDDPDDVYARTENIHTVVRPGFVADHPDAARFFRQYRLDRAQLQDLMDQLRHTDERPLHIARRWMQAHPDAVDGWLKGIGPRHRPSAD